MQTEDRAAEKRAAEERAAEERAAMERLYSVTELANDLGVTPRAIRFYEDQGLISPQRAGTTRVYSHRDRARMILILRGKRLGFSLKEIKEYLDLYVVDTSQTEQMRLLLERVQTRIAQLEDQRQALEQTLAELHDIERMATEGLAAKKQRAQSA